MNYPGNPTLGDEVRQRILDTFAQSLELAETGRPQEAALGCDFILELDPQFKPATQLKDRLASGDGQGLDDLRAYVGGESAASADDDLFDLDSLDLPDLDAPEPPAPFAPAPAPAAEPGPAAGGLAAELGKLLAARDFQGVLDRAAQVHDQIVASPELRGTVEAAQSRLEAQPYVESFLKDAGAALRTGDGERARVALDKARSLDASHPLISELELAYQRAAEPQSAGPASSVSSVSAGLDADAGTGEPEFDLGAEGDAFDLSLDTDDESTTDDAEDEDLFAGFEMPDLDDQDLIAPPPSAAAPPAAEPAPDSLELDAPPSELPDLSSALSGGVGAASPGGGESDDRIGQLLAEGQEAADRGDYQTAIDAWSRIFLIDVDHEEAARRIEDARRQKAEREREVEEVFHDGLDALERGEKDQAKAQFQKVLEVQPNHLAAREYLQQIEAGGPVTGLDEQVAGVQDVASGLGNFDLSDLSGGGETASSEPLKQEILVPPAPGEKPDPSGGVASAYDDAASGTPVVAPRRVAAGARSGRRSFLLIGGLVLVLVAVAAWFVLQNKERFFPNSTTDEAAATAAVSEGQSTLERAKALHEKGNTGMALAQLKRIRPDQPEYKEAQALISSWQEPAAPAPEKAAKPTVSPEDMNRRQGLIDQAAAAYGRHEFLRALELYDAARGIAPLEGRDLDNFRQSATELEPLKRQIELFHEGEYEIIMPELWRMLEDDPANPDARQLLVSSYYNRGVRELQRGDAARAAAEFQEALSLAPDDEELQRHYLFAKTYEQRSKDLLYRIYVKYLQFR